MGRRVLLYNSTDGKLIKQLKGHKDQVYSVSYSYDGTRIASGGADKSTIIWNEEGKGILKFTHSESVQVVAYNPVEDLLASCSSADFGFWSPKEKSVIKHKVDSKILCASWRNDGQVIALGLFSGNVSLYNIHGNEIGIIARNAPVWSLCWNRYSSSDDHNSDILAVGSWDMTLSFYDEFFQQQNEDYCLDYYPSSVEFYGRSSEYVIVGGSSGSLNLFSKEGVFLENLCNHRGWIWCVRGVGKKQQVIACVDSSGLISSYRFVNDSSIHDKWKGCIAYRDCCTDIVIHDSSKDQRRRIKCGTFVKALAMIHNKIAVAIKEKILIYERSSSTNEYTLKHSINIEKQTNFIKMTSNHLIICTQKKMKAYTLRGEFVREWNVDDSITCTKNLCTIQGEERLLVGCENGKILAVSIESLFHTTILELGHPITSIDISCKSRYIGVICDKCHLVIFDQITKVHVQDMKGPESINFHDEIDYIYSYGNDGIVTIQDVHIPEFSQVASSRGSIISFSRARVLSLQKDLSCHHIDINMSSLAYQKMKNNDYDAALEIAFLVGSTDNFFKYLAKEALLNSNFAVSSKCFMHLNIPNMIEYVRMKKLKTPQDCASPNQVKAIIIAEMAIMENKFVEAGEILKKADMTDKLIEFLVKMSKFQEAKELLQGDDETTLNYIVSKEAEWEAHMKNWKKASALYVECRCYLKAVKLVGECKGEGWITVICDLTQNIPDTEIEALKKCCHYLTEEDGLGDTIKNIYIKIKDYSSLMRLYVNHQLWIEVAQLYQDHENNIDKSLLVPYADWLAVQGRLDDATLIYRKIGRQDKSIKLLLSLIENSILDESFRHVSMLHRMLAKETILMVST